MHGWSVDMDWDWLTQKVSRPTLAAESCSHPYNFLLPATTCVRKSFDSFWRSFWWFSKFWVASMIAFRTTLVVPAALAKWPHSYRRLHLPQLSTHFQTVSRRRISSFRDSLSALRYNISSTYKVKLHDALLVLTSVASSRCFRERDLDSWTPWKVSRHLGGRRPLATSFYRQNSVSSTTRLPFSNYTRAKYPTTAVAGELPDVGVITKDDVALEMQSTILYRGMGYVGGEKHLT